MTAPHEEWRASLSFPTYEVSDLGRVRHRLRGVPLKGYVADGYQYVSIRVEGQKRGIGRRVNRMVCEAFHGPAPTSDHVSAHGDNDRLNNRSDNLRWATSAENRADMHRHGTAVCRENSARTKYPASTVRSFLRGLTGEYGDLKVKAEQAGIPYNTATKFSARKDAFLNG